MHIGARCYSCKETVRQTYKKYEANIFRILISRHAINIAMYIRTKVMKVSIKFIPQDQPYIDKQMITNEARTVSKLPL